MKNLTKEIKVGLMVAVSILILLAIFYKMGNFDFTKKGYNINVLFGFAGGIANNAPVRLLGVEVGKVEKVDLQYGDETRVILTLWLDQSTKLKADAKAYVSALGLMGEKYIEINPGSQNAPFLEPGSIITGEDPFQMETFTKNGEELMNELRGALKNMQSLAANVDGMVVDNRDEIDNILKNVEVTTTNLKELSTDLKRNPWKIITKPPDWKKRLQ